MEDQKLIRFIKIGMFLTALSINDCVVAEVQTPVSVQVFYGGMKELGQTIDANKAYDIGKSMKECFFGMDVSVSGISLPNDFRFFKYDGKNPSHTNETLNSATYVNRLKDYIYKDRVLEVNYKILKNEYAGEQPDFSKGRMTVSTSLVATFIEKMYNLKGFQKLFRDTVYTDYSSGKISEIKNGNGMTVVNIASLRTQAALAYRMKQYETAYKCYTQILVLYPNDSDTLYRVALMTYYRQGCDFLKKKQARKRGVEYMKRAQAYGYYSDIGAKAANVLHNWEYPVI